MGTVNVVSIRSAHSAVNGEENRFLADLQGLVWSSQGPCGTWQQLADKAGLCYSTVRKFAVGETKRPQVRTVERLMLALGYRLALVPSNVARVQHEIDLSEYRIAKRA